MPTADAATFVVVARGGGYGQSGLWSAADTSLASLAGHLLPASPYMLIMPKLPKAGVEFKEGCEKFERYHAAVNQRPKVCSLCGRNHT
jgi:hypothetical protein